MATRKLVYLDGHVKTFNPDSDDFVISQVRIGTEALNSILSKTILDNLIALQNGSDFSTGTNAHTHDGRYFTETELSSATASSGSDLIGDDDTYSNFTPTAATVKGALAGIDAALASAGLDLEWQNSVLDRAVTPPMSPTTGDRYLIDATLGAATGAWTGQEDDIAIYNGSGWDFYTPTTGTFVSADDELDRLYYFGGSGWAPKLFESTTASGYLSKVGQDIQLTDLDENHVIVGNGSNVAADVDTNSAGDVLAHSTNGLTIKNSAKDNLFRTFTNNSGSTIVAGSIVALDSSGEIVLADADAAATSLSVVGVVHADIADAASGLVQIAGRRNGIAGGALTIGAPAYLSQTAGEATSTAPTASGTFSVWLGVADSADSIILNVKVMGQN